MLNWTLWAMLFFLAPTMPAGPRAQAPPPTPANAKARQLVAQAIAAMGGDHYLQANARTGKGRLYTFNSSGQLNGPGSVFWSYWRFPADERIELTEKRNVVYIYAGGKGWEITFRGVAPMLAKQLQQYADTSAHSLDVILKQWASDDKTLMLDQGLSTYDQQQVESVAFTTNDGDAATVDFSLTSQLPVRVHWRREDPDTGGHYEEAVVYGDWIRQGAIYAPFTIEHYEGDQAQDQRFYTSMDFAPLPAGIFIPTELGKRKKN